VQPLIRPGSVPPVTGADLRFGAASLAAIETAAGALARLDTALDTHPLARAWLYRARLDAVRREAASDGRLIDPWHLAAMIEGVRFRVSGETLLDRGLIFAAAGHAFELYRWRVYPDAARRDEIARATTHIRETALPYPALAGAAVAVHSWLDRGGERAPLRAALSDYWTLRRISHLPLPFSAAAALAAETPWAFADWSGEFLGALAAEAEAGLDLLRRLERSWFAVRHMVAGRRRGSFAGAAVDMLAAVPVASATTLAAALGIAPKNAARLLKNFTTLGIAVEVTHRAKRRLYGLQNLAPLREAAAPPRRASRTGRGHGRPRDQATLRSADPEPVAAAPLQIPPPLPRLDRHAFDFSDIDRLLDLTDQAIRRVEQVLAADVRRVGSSSFKHGDRSRSAGSGR